MLKNNSLEKEQKIQKANTELTLQNEHILKISPPKNQQFSKAKEITNVVKLDLFQNFIRAIMQHRPTKRQIQDLQLLKSQTQMEIGSRFIISKMNIQYRFPFISDKKNEGQENRSKLQYNNKEKQKNCSKETNQSFKIFQRQYLQFFNNKIQSQQEEQFQFRGSLFDFYEKLKNNRFYDLKEQNSHLQSHNEFNSNLQPLQFSSSETPKYFKNLTIVEPNSKLLSLQSKKSKKMNKIQKSPIKSQNHQSLQGLRMARLIHRQKQILAIRSQQKLKVKDYNMSLLSPEERNRMKTLTLKIDSIPQKDIDTSQSQNSLYTEINPEAKQSKAKLIRNQKIKKGKQGRFLKLQTLKLMSLSEKKLQTSSQIKQKSSFFPLITNRLPNRINQTAKNIHLNDFALLQDKSLTFANLRKIKKLGNEVEDNIKELMSKKLKTQINSPKCYPCFILHKQSLSQKKDLSKIFSNQRFKTLETEPSTNLMKSSPKQKSSQNFFKKLNQNKQKKKQLTFGHKNKIKEFMYGQNSNKNRKDMKLDVKGKQKRIFIKQKIIKDENDTRNYYKKKIYDI